MFASQDVRFKQSVKPSEPQGEKDKIKLTCTEAEDEDKTKVTCSEPQCENDKTMLICTEPQVEKDKTKVVCSKPSGGKDKVKVSYPCNVFVIRYSRN